MKYHENIMAICPWGYCAQKRLKNPGTKWFLIKIHYRRKGI